MPNEWIKEGSENYFEKLMDRKVIAHVHLDWDFLMETKFKFSHVLEWMNCR